MVYERPEMKITRFDVEDVITTSTNPTSATTTTTVVVSVSGNENREEI